MADEPFTSPNHIIPPRVPRSGELLFEFVRASDRARMSCELRLHGEITDGKRNSFERDELLYSRGGFVMRELAIRWAGAMEKAVSGFVRQEMCGN